MLVVVGLGNPGASYKNTRHNAGFMVVDGIADGKFLNEARIKPTKKNLLNRVFTSRAPFGKSSGPYARVEGELDMKTFMLVKPTTYMNASGRAVSNLVRRGKVRNLEELLVVVDDVNLDTGRIRFREKGSAGGQNGLKSIIASVGSDEFPRLRIGIGPKPSGENLSDYVLRSFRPDEKKLFNRSIEEAAELVGEWITGGAQAAQNYISRLGMQ